MVPTDIEPGDSLQGSPRRVLERYIVKADDRYILEKVSWIKRKRREEQANILEILVNDGLPVERYLRAMDGAFIVEKDGLWMLKEYVNGAELRRPLFLKDGWRGKIAAEFLLRMRSLSKKDGIDVEGPHLPSFIEGLMKRLERKMPDVRTSLEDAYDSILPLLQRWDAMPSSFSHGDYHPINIIWGEEKINAVIDWEFTGRKPELYDAASMLGCIGIEDADGLFSPFAGEFVGTLKKGDFSESSWELLPELILATRFAWLDEWMRNRDEEMLGTELEYMAVLSENIASLREYFS